MVKRPRRERIRTDFRIMAISYKGLANGGFALDGDNNNKLKKKLDLVYDREQRGESVCEFSDAGEWSPNLESIFVQSVSLTQTETDVIFCGDCSASLSTTQYDFQSWFARE